MGTRTPLWTVMQQAEGEVGHALANHQQAPIALGVPIDHWDPDDRTRRELRNLADELEGRP